MADIFGTPGPDTLIGTGDADRIRGFGGNDRIEGRDGADFLVGDDGDDEIIGGDGFDELFGGAGDDFLDGGPGFDRLSGGPGADRINGGDGGDGVDFGDSPVGVIVDLAVGAAFDGVSLDQLSSIEFVYGSSFGDQVFGSPGDDLIEGGGGNDRLLGEGGDDDLEGGDGDDIIFGGPGFDELDGEFGGSDTVAFSDNERGVSVDLAATRADDGVFVDEVSGFENILGSRFSDMLRGDASDNVIDGGPGADLIDGRDGRDYVSYATATGPVIVDLNEALVFDGLQQDILVSIEGVIGSSFADTIFGSESVFSYFDLSDGGADRVGVGAAGGEVSYARSTRSVIIDLGAGAAFDGVDEDTLTNVTTAVGSNFNDTFFGSERADKLSGGLGNDTINGFGGDDTLSGGDGNDVFIGGSGRDTYFGGPGLDVVSYVDSDFAVVGDRTSATVGGQTETLTSIEGFRGSRFNDTLAGFVQVDGGPAGADRLIALDDFTRLSHFTSARGVTVDLAAGTSFDGVDMDTLEGGFFIVTDSLFDDVILGSAENDVFLYLVGGADRFDARGGDNDTLDASLILDRGVFIDLTAGRSFDGIVEDVIIGFENAVGGAFGDFLAGDGAANYLFGAGGDDRLFGEGGRDILDGGLGADTMEGGGGADRFLIAVGGTQGDIILDFRGAEGDTLDASSFGVFAEVAAVGPDLYRITSDAGVSETLTIRGDFDPNSDVFFG